MTYEVFVIARQGILQIFSITPKGEQRQIVSLFTLELCLFLAFSSTRMSQGRGIGSAPNVCSSHVCIYIYKYM